MASLAEMMNYADWTSKNSPAGNVAGTIESGVEGVFAGANAAQRQRRAQLDTTLKILDIQEKMQKMQLEARKQKMNENMLKAMGLAPMDAEDHSAAMDTAWGRLGNGKDPKYPNTPEGKLASMANNMDWRPGWSVGGGVSLHGVPKKSDSASASKMNTELQTQKEDLAIAKSIVVAKKVKQQEAGIPDYVKGTKMAQKIDPSKIAVEADELMAALPLARAIRTGDKKTYEKLMGANASPPPETSPTVGILAAVAAQRNRLLAQTAAMNPPQPTKSVSKPKSDAPRSIWDPAASVSNDEETDTEE